MNNVNYNETIVIPALQKKIQELQNTNLVLELSLLIEQNKSKDIQSTYSKMASEAGSATQDIEEKGKKIIFLKQELQNVTTERDKYKNDYVREVSVKESVMNEYNQLKAKVQDKDNALSDYNNLKAKIDELQSVINTLRSENETLKTAQQNTAPKRTRKKQEVLEEVMLDGETY